MARSRSYVFTLNNPDVPQRWMVLPRKVRYLCWQLEKGEDEGTLHLQGCVYLDNATTLTGVKRILNSNEMHLEIMRGNWDQAIAYCTKEETRQEGPWELGDKPTQGKRKDLDVIKEKLDAGASDLDIAEDHFGSWCRYNKSFTMYRSLKRQCRKPDDPLTVVLCTGPPGYGKSHYVSTTLTEWGLSQGYQGIYRKTPQCKWFDHYEGEQIVIFDDIDGSWFPWSTLLQILDIYPLMVEPKGQLAIKFNPRLILMTSNKEPENWYQGQVTEALLRRITHRVYFDSPRALTYVKGAALEPPPQQTTTPAPLPSPITISEEEGLLTEEERLLFDMIELED